MSCSTSRTLSSRAKDFPEYVEMVLGIPYGEAMRAAEIYRKLVHEQKGKTDTEQGPKTT